METIVSDSKQTILDAAEELIARCGYSGLSMRELSKESGLAKSTLYHYFQDKHDIYLKVIERELLVMRETIESAAAIDGSPEEKLRAVVTTHFRLLNERGDVAFNALRRASSSDDELSELFRYHRSHIVAPIVDILDSGIEAGIFRPMDTRLTVMSIFGMVSGYVAQRVIFGEITPDVTHSEDELVNHTLALLLDGVRQ